MKNINTQIILCLLLLPTTYLWAQQQWQYSQYMNNNYLLNPAEGGTEMFTDIKIGYRSQWVGLEGAPTSTFISIHHPINKNISNKFEDVTPLAHHGVGGYITNDKTGPFTRSGIYGSYSYLLPLSRSFTVSFGAFAGVKQYRLDANSIRFEAGETDAVLNESSVSYIPDATLGIWVYSKTLYFGSSIFQVFGNNLNLLNENNDPGSLSRHLFLTAGYKAPLSESIFLVPSFVVKYASPAPVQFDLNMKIRYEDLYWAGVSYRNKDAIILMAGLTVQKKWELGYSYDFNTSGLSGHNSGSHEILIGYRIHNHHEPPPAQFW